ncbi:membrane protein [Kwoniella heveanensis BCC8398]|uniref:Membrane protein n=1 Tax=Kwoniella heveanensis BCC8398 TaxID=1296120 RepID=A0A1B9GM85_9TREE|nr:membrane protein [Kwoniella heveanensis BCC8398]
MSQIDAAPPNTYAGGRDDNLRVVRVNDAPYQHRSPLDDDFDAVVYRNEVPLWKRIRNHSLTQMMLISIQAFCGPAMADAIAGLGGGGLATPTVNNIANAVSYASLALVCLFGGPLVNKLGTKWALVLGALSFPLRGASFYTNSKFGNQWFLIVGSFLEGVGTGAWYVAESGTIMSIAPTGARGKYLALWIVSRNMGQLIGGAINLAKNNKIGEEGGVTPDTYIIFLIIECLAIPFAFLITPLENVVRSDGTRVRVAEKITTGEEFKMIKTTWSSKLIMFTALWAFWSFFYGGSWSTYLGLYFSVRARALSSLISPFLCIVGCFGLGFILDLKGLSQRRRAQIGLYTVVILNAAVYIWSIIMQVRFNKNDPGSIDWSSSKYPSAFLPYFFIQTTGPLSQSYMYWLLSSFATDAQANVRNGAAFRCIESIGQAVAYGMNSKTGESPLVGFCVTFGLMAAALPTLIVLVNSTPDRIPADVLAEEDAANAKIDVGGEKKIDPVTVTIEG